MASASSREVLRNLSTLFHCGTAGQLSDSELLERFVTGRDEESQAAFTALVERHGVMVLGVCRRVLGNRDEVEDAFQATFLVLARKASAIARRDQLASWLHGVARRAALDARTRANRQKAREKRWGAMRPVEQPDQTSMSELRAVLDEELAHLPERHRAAIVLCELEGLSRRDAAIRLGVSEGTLSSRLSRAKSRLRDRLIRRGFALSSAALTSVLAQDAQAVILPPLLLDSTVQIATLVAAGSSLTGVASTPVATLTEGVIKAMLLAKLKFASLGLFTLAVVSTSVGVVAQSPVPVSPDRLSDNDRLRSVERKLDKLLEVMGGSGHSARPGGLTAPVAVPPPPPVAAAPTPLPAPAAAAGLQANMMRGMMGGMPGMGHMGSLSPDQLDLGARVSHLEQRLGDLERRLVALERRLPPTLPKTGDARGEFFYTPGNQHRAPSSIPPHAPETPAAAHPNASADVFSDTPPAAEVPAQAPMSTSSLDVLAPGTQPPSSDGNTASAPSPSAGQN